MAESGELIPSLPLDLALDCLYRVPLCSIPSVQQVCTSWRSLLSSPSFYHARHAKGCSDFYACFIEASSSSPGKTPVYGVSVYDEKQNVWGHLPPIPASQHGLPLFCSCVAVGSQILLFGGLDPASFCVLTSVYIFDFTASRWRCGTRMPTARSFFACAAIEGKVVIAGGHDESKNALRSAELYDVGRDAWESLPDMHLERDECKAACLDGKVMIVSGFSTDSQGQFMACAERLDMAARRWDMVDGFWLPGRPPSSIVPLKGRLYALLDGKLLCLSLLQREWELVLALPAASLKFTACLAALSDGILVVGFQGATECVHMVRCRRRGGQGPWGWSTLEGSPFGTGTVQQTASTLQV